MGWRQGLASLGLASILSGQMVVPKAKADAALQDMYSRIGQSTVQIQNESAYRCPTMSQNAATPLLRIVKSTWFGTGVVISKETVQRDGLPFSEYAILTNNHVAVADKYTDKENRLDDTADSFKANCVLEQTRLNVVVPPSKQSERPFNDNRVALEVIANDPDHDAALLRTVRTSKQLHVFPYALGASEFTDARMVSYGHPLAGPLQMFTGKITDVDVSPWVTPFLHQHYLTTLPTNFGQSGSSFDAVSVEEMGNRVRIAISLVGLVYAKRVNWTDPMAPTNGFVTPYSEFGAMVQSRTSTPSQRPSIDKAVSLAQVQEVEYKSPNNVFSIDTHSYVVTRAGEKFVLSEYVSLKGMAQQRIEISFAVSGGVRIDSIGVVQGSKKEYLDLLQAPQEMREFYGKVTTNLLNHFAMRTARKQASVDAIGKYLDRVIAEDQLRVSRDMSALRSDLYIKRLLTLDDF